MFSEATTLIQPSEAPFRAFQAASPGAHAGLPTGSVTLLFCDIEGSTRLLRQLGGPAYSRVLGAQRRLLRSVFQTWDGHEVDTTGDGCFAVFKHAPYAVAAAVAAQCALAAHPWPQGVQVRVRMGLHTGRPAPFEGGYVGLEVHVAARICAAARGGQTLLSRDTRELVEHQLPAGVSLRNAGPYWLTDLDHPQHLSDLRHTFLPAGCQA
jgi:class 3 adenylate cyclase